MKDFLSKKKYLGQIIIGFFIFVNKFLQIYQ